MPQMAPTWWLILMIIFITTYMLVMIIIYFNNSYTPTYNEKQSNSKKSINWKW